MFLGETKSPGTWVITALNQWNPSISNQTHRSKGHLWTLTIPSKKAIAPLLWGEFNGPNDVCPESTSPAAPMSKTVTGASDERPIVPEARGALEGAVLRQRRPRGALFAWSICQEEGGEGGLGNSLRWIYVHIYLFGFGNS